MVYVVEQESNLILPEHDGEDDMWSKPVRTGVGEFEFRYTVHTGPKLSCFLWSWNRTGAVS